MRNINKSQVEHEAEQMGLMKRDFMELHKHSAGVAFIGTVENSREERKGR